jgi:hypothetical protein
MFSWLMLILAWLSFPSRRAGDLDKMLSSFDRLVLRTPSLSDADLMQLLYVGPIIGRWNAVKRMGDELSKRLGGLTVSQLFPQLLFDILLMDKFGCPAPA